MEFIEQKCKEVHKILSNFKATFEQREKRSKCPRCKGLGLMDDARHSFLKSGYASKEPCWFCEGVGILPIIGLNGFLLARASSHIHTHDLMVRTLSPVPIEKSFVNHIGRNCKITRCKPAVQISKCTPHNAEMSNLDVLSNHAIYDTLYSLYNPVQVKDEMATHNKCTVIDGSKASDKSYKANMELNIQKDLDTLKASVGVQAEVLPGSSIVTVGRQKHSQSNRSENVYEVEKRSETSKHVHFTRTSGYSFSPDVFLIESALKLGAQNKTFDLQTNPFNDSVLTESGTKHILSDLALPTVRFNKINRNSRRKRNRIREKAQKEANENARRILQSLTPRTNDVFTAPPNETPEDAPVVISTKGDEAIDFHFRSETSKRLPFFKFRHEWSILRRTGPNNLSMKNVGVPLLKKRGLTLAKPVRTLKN